MLFDILSTASFLRASELCDCWRHAAQSQPLESKVEQICKKCVNVAVAPAFVRLRHLCKDGFTVETIVLVTMLVEDPAFDSLFRLHFPISNTESAPFCYPSTSSQAAMPLIKPALIQVAIKSVASSRVIASRAVVADYHAQGPLWMRVVDAAKMHHIRPATGEDAAAFAIFHDVGYKAKDVDTEVCLPIGDGTNTPADKLELAEIYDVPALPRVASVTYKGAYDGLSSVYCELFGWIGRQGETVSGPVREIYHVGLDGISKGEEDKLVTEIIVPLA